MRQFTDLSGKTWSLSVNVGSALRLKGAGFDVVSLADGKLLEQLYSDPFTLGAMLWVLCEEQARQAGVSEQQFVEGLAGNVLDAAVNAVALEIIDFFPSPRRAALLKSWEKMLSLEQAALARISTELDNLTLDKALELAGNNSRLNSPGLSGSIPAP